MRIAFDVPLVKAVFGLERQRGKKIVIIKRSHASRKACNNLILFLEPGDEPGALAENCRHKSSPKAVVFRHNISKLILWICCAECLLPSSDGNKPRLFLFGLLDLAQRKQPFFNELFSKSRQGENMEKGFTLIELLVVVLIIGILAAVALPQYEKVVAKVRFTKVILQVEGLRKAEELYYLATGNSFIGGTDVLDIDVMRGCTGNGSMYYKCPTGLNLDGNNALQGIISGWYCPEKVATNEYCVAEKSTVRFRLSLSWAKSQQCTCSGVSAVDKILCQQFTQTFCNK